MVQAVDRSQRASTRCLVDVHKSCSPHPRSLQYGLVEGECLECDQSLECMACDGDPSLCTK